MKKTFLLLLILIFGFGLFGCSMGPKMSAEEIKNIVDKVKNSRLILLDIYHNRCESCKLIEPVFNKLEEEKANDSNIAFLKYDLSNPFTIINSRRIAKELGLDDIYKTQRFSGIVLFIDPKTKEVTDTLIAEYNIDKYNEIIEKRLSGI